MRNSAGRNGHSLEIFQPRTRLQSSRNIFTNRVWKGWNSLTEHIVTAPPVNAFKARLDKYWKDNPAVYNYKLSALDKVEFRQGSTRPDKQGSSRPKHITRIFLDKVYHVQGRQIAKYCGLTTSHMSPMQGLVVGRRRMLSTNT